MSPINNPNTNRVVITGMGILCPLGLDMNTTWENIIAGKSGIGHITLFDTERFETKIAGEVKGFEPTDYINRKDARRMDRFAQLAVARPGDDPEHPTTLVTVSVDEGDGQNPVTLLAEAVAEGRSGLIEAGSGRSGLGRVVQIAALVAATTMAAGGVFLLRRGLGSTRARR